MDQAAGLLINLNPPTPKSGLNRIVNYFSENSASLRLGVKKDAKKSLEHAPAIS